MSTAIASTTRPTPAMRRDRESTVGVAMARHVATIVCSRLIVIRLSCLALAGVIAWEAARAADMPRFRLPLLCEPWRSCAVQNYVDHEPSAGVRDYACGSLTYDGHDGTDFRLRSLRAMREGVDVLSAADGTVARARDGVPDVSFRTREEAVRGRECGNGVVVRHVGGWETQYCHLARGSISVRPGDAVKAGDRLGQVGLSGKTEFPHLHFTVRRDGKTIDPFAFGASTDGCSAGRSLWDPAVVAAFRYRAGFVFEAGFAAAPVNLADIETGWTPPSAEVAGIDRVRQSDRASGRRCPTIGDPRTDRRGARRRHVRAARSKQGPVSDVCGQEENR